MMKEVKNEGDFNPFWDFKEDGPMIEGHYVSKRESTFKKKSGGTFKKIIYCIETNDGTRYDVGGSTVLNRKMAEVPEKALVQIKYLGLKSGENEYHDYAVLYDD